jgi:hypothetical protein
LNRPPLICRMLIGIPNLPVSIYLVHLSSTKAKAYQWAAAIAGEIDPKLGWGPEDLIGGECVVVLEAAEDAQGTEKNKVVKVKPPRRNKPAASKREADGSEGDIVQIPL